MSENKKPEEMNLQEFMNWLLEEYPGIQRVLPSDYTRAIDGLNGYALAKKNEPEAFILSGAVDCLQQAANFFEVLRRYWKIGGK